MSEQRYRYEVAGTDYSGRAWTCEGIVETPGAGAFMEAVEQAMLASMDLLTGGKAVYGFPGVGCHGPYIITRLSLAVVPDG